MSERLRFAWECAKQRRRWEGDVSLRPFGRLRRHALTAKAIICLALGREGSRSWALCDAEPCCVDGIALVDFARTWHPEFGEGGEFTSISVGGGLFRNWHVHVDLTGWP